MHRCQDQFSRGLVRHDESISVYPMPGILTPKNHASTIRVADCFVLGKVAVVFTYIVVHHLGIS
jgi:hypothetical protein